MLRILAKTIFLLVAVLCSGMMARHGVMAQTSPGMIGQQEAKGLSLTITSNKVLFTLEDKIEIYPKIRRESGGPIRIMAFLGWGYRASLVLKVFDSEGNEVKREWFDDAPHFPPGRDEQFVWLFRGHEYGIRRRDQIKELGITKPGKYRLVVSFSTPFPEWRIAELDIDDKTPILTREMDVVLTAETTIEVIPADR